MTNESIKQTRSRDLWVHFGRVAWFGILILFLSAFFVGMPHRFAELRTACAVEECADVALSTQEAAELNGLGFSLDFYAGFVVAGEIFVVAIHTLLATLLFARRSADKTGLFISSALVMIGYFFTSGGIALLNVLPNLYLLFNILGSMAMVSFVLLFFLFPDGRFVPRWTRILAALLVAYMLVAAFISNGILWYTPSLLNSILFTLTFTSLGMGLFAQIYRYRRVSSRSQRQQTKWVIFGLCTIIVVFIMYSVPFVLYPLPPGAVRVYYTLGSFAILFLLISLFPLSIAFAILRYRLWDIDHLIRRTLVYSILTGLLLLVYFGSVVALQSLVSAFGVQPSAFVTVVSTLAIAALFTPLRRRVQDFIDRRFYRQKYDAEQTLAAFAATARDEVDMDRLGAALVSVVEETMQPEQVSIWFTTKEPKTGTR